MNETRFDTPARSPIDGHGPRRNHAAGVDSDGGTDERVHATSETEHGRQLDVGELIGPRDAVHVERSSLLRVERAQTSAHGVQERKIQRDAADRTEFGVGLFGSLGREGSTRLKPHMLSRDLRR